MARGRSRLRLWFRPIASGGRGRGTKGAAVPEANAWVSFGSCFQITIISLPPIFLDSPISSESSFGALASPDSEATEFTYPIEPIHHESDIDMGIHFELPRVDSLLAMNWVAEMSLPIWPDSEDADVSPDSDDCMTDTSWVEQLLPAVKFPSMIRGLARSTSFYLL